MISAILLAGGTGTRMKSSTPKQYLPLADKPIALHSFDLLTSSSQISEIVVVCEPKFRSHFPHSLFALPGTRRQDSLYNGLQCTNPLSTHILVHDAARPFITQADLENLIEMALIYDAATLATPLTATIKKASADLFVTQTLDRTTLFEIQTPQMLRKSVLEAGLAKALLENITVTDDVSLAELIDHPVKLVIGSESNIKITTPKDLAFAEHACQI